MVPSYSFLFVAKRPIFRSQSAGRGDAWFPFDLNQPRKDAASFFLWKNQIISPIRWHLS